jgi:hypothetical protein
MSTKKIFSIGYDFPGGLLENIPFDSDHSLFDCDIVLFNPSIFSFSLGQSSTYKGKPSLPDSQSFRLQERILHWKKELKNAYNEGKLIVVLLSQNDIVYVATGDKQYSGTGRNRVETRMVRDISNYESIPIKINIINAKGKELRIGENVSFVKELYDIIKPYLEYQVYIEGEFSQVLFTTKNAFKILGACVMSSQHSGAIVFLPHIDTDIEEFEEEKNEEIFWSKKAITFGNKFIRALINLDSYFKSTTDLSVKPTWINEKDFTLKKEEEINKNLLVIEKKIVELVEQKEKDKKELEEEGYLKYLLYEKGKPLEKAILKALRILGFTANPFKESDSEFDAVFESEEGRFIGEAEGKDNKPINIDKLRQLEMNINEDFSRENIKEIAKGVLFGNAFRFTHPSERSNFFTDKCYIAAKRSKVALVRTTDLFIVAKYLSENKSKTFEKKCRDAIFSASGEEVYFPPLPQSENFKFADTEINK